jgi:ATP-dependent helicase/nuclease subunit B
MAAATHVGPASRTDAEPSAYTRLRAQVTAVQADDPFAPCTVVVPHRAVAYDVARALTSGPRSGVVGVRTPTLLDLADEIVAETAALSGRTPLTTTGLRAALAEALAEDPGPFVEVADQPATLDALADASTRLLRAEHLGADAVPPITRAVVALHRRAATRLAGTYTAQDVFAEATRLLETDPGVAERLGSVIRFQLPAQHDPVARGFVEALGGEVIEPTVHDPASVRRSIDALVSVTDPVEEARAAVEAVASALEDTAGQRVGIFFPTPDPYLGLVTAQLRQAGISFTARGLAPALADPSSRHLVRLLEQDPEQIDLRALLDARWADVLQRGLPSSRALENGYVYGMTPQEDGPSASASETGRSSAGGPSAPDPDDEAAPTPDDEAWQALSTLRDTLADRLRAIDEAPTWREAAARIVGVRRELLDDPRHRSSCRPEDRRVQGAIDEALRSLADGRADTANPGREVLAGHLASELAGTGFREGRLSTGVVVGTLPSAVGRDLDLVVVLGMADGIAPAPSAVDPLLPEDAIRALGGALRTPQQQRDEQRDQFAAAIAAGRRVLVTTPRGRLREPGPLFLSPWIAPHSILEAAADDVQGPDDGLAELSRVVHVVDSPLAGARDGYGAREGDGERDGHAPQDGYGERNSCGVPGPAGSIGRAWQRQLLAVRRPGPSPIEDPDAATDTLPAASLRAREIRADRREGRFTRFTGNLHAVVDKAPPGTHGLRVTNPVTSPDAGSPDEERLAVSPTGLELWAKDPFSYFLERVLHVELFAYPDEEEQADAKTLGNIVHETLEQVVLTQIATGAVPSEDEVEDILQQVFTAHRQSAWTEVLWHAQQTIARNMVGRAVAELRTGADPGAPSDLAFRPLGAESRFGNAHGRTAPFDALEIPVDGQRLLVVRGSVDRIDRLADGTLRVVDYKTGSPFSYQGIVGDPDGRVRSRNRTDPFDPTAGGTKLQLPLYALHAERDHADAQTPTGPPLRVEYHFLRDDPATTIGFAWIPEVREEFAHQLRRVTDAIEAGIFPIRAEKPSSLSHRVTWYTVMGDREQWRLGQKLAEDPVVSRALDARTLMASREENDD